MNIVNKFKSLANRVMHPNTHSSDAFVAYLRRSGVRIGEGCVFFDPQSCTIDVTNPELLSMGDNVRITHGVTILTHDYSWSVLCGVYGEVLGGVSEVHLGNNIFIGMNSTILRGVSIGDNVIIGAGSVVAEDVPSGEIWGGFPAHKIKTIEKYYERKKNSSYNDAIALAKRFKNDNQCLKRIMREYEPLFTDFNDGRVQELMDGTGYGAKCRDFYKNNNRRFANFEEMLESVE